MWPMIFAPSAIDAASSRRGDPIHLFRKSRGQPAGFDPYGDIRTWIQRKIQVSILLPNHPQISLDNRAVLDYGRRAGGAIRDCRSSIGDRERFPGLS
jgi:hypothetical protein